VNPAAKFGPFATAAAQGSGGSAVRAYLTGLSHRQSSTLHCAITALITEAGLHVSAEPMTSTGKKRLPLPPIFARFRWEWHRAGFRTERPEWGRTAWRDGLEPAFSSCFGGQAGGWGAGVFGGPWPVSPGRPGPLFPGFRGQPPLPRISLLGFGGGSPQRRGRRFCSV